VLRYSKDDPLFRSSTRLNPTNCKLNPTNHSPTNPRPTNLKDDMQ